MTNPPDATATTQYPVYLATRPCRICGAKDATTRWCIGGDWLGWTVERCRVYGDHIHRHCQRCGYHWTESPVTNE